MFVENGALRMACSEPGLVEPGTPTTLSVVIAGRRRLPKLFATLTIDGRAAPGPEVAPRDRIEPGSRSYDLAVPPLDEGATARVGLSVGAGRGALSGSVTLTAAVSPPAPEPPPATGPSALRDLALGPDPAMGALLDRLAREDVTSAPDLLARRDAGTLPTTPDAAALDRLVAHAELAGLPLTAGEITGLVDAGLRTPADVAALPPDALAALVPRPDQAQALHATAAVQAGITDALTTGIRIARANGSPIAADTQAGIAEEDCGCEDCKAATSPMAYLADLLAYATARLTDAGDSVSTATLARLLRQPLNDLPPDCATTEEQVSAVRLVVESLEDLAATELRADPDVAASPLAHPINFVVAADVDGDGQDELVLGFDEVWPSRGEPPRSGLWVMRYDRANGRWRHLRPGTDRRGAALLLPFGTHALSGFAGHFATDAAGRRHLAVRVTVDGATPGARWWLLRYEPADGSWTHLAPTMFTGFGADLVLPVDTVAGAFAADVDGDGIDEVVAFGETPPATPGGAPRLDAFWTYKLTGAAWNSLGAPGDPYDVAFTAFSPPGHPSPARLATATAGDLDLDGRAEIVAVPADLDGRYVAVLRYAGTPGQWEHVNPSGQPFEADIALPAPGPTAYALVGSVAGINRPDLLLARGSWPGADVTRFQEWRYDKTEFVEGPVADPTTDPLPVDAALLADVDGDGRDELVILTHSGQGATRRDAAWVMDRDDVGTWRHLTPIAGHALGADLEWTPGGRWGALQVLAADVDRDGRDELVVSRGDANQIWVLDLDPDTGTWRHLSPVRPPAAEGRYARAAYDSLLLSAGATTADLRRAAAASPAERSTLAERLGVGPAGLAALSVDPAAVDMASLERVFGLASTRRDPLSDGPAGGPGAARVARWRLDGVRWSADPVCAGCDPDGVVHLRIDTAGAQGAVVMAYRDAARTAPVATGNGPFDSDVTLRQLHGSGVEGSVRPLAGTGTADAQLRVFPELAVHRWRRLRTQWDTADVPDDPFRPGEPAGAVGRRPVVDPAVIGPDDFRLPLPKAAAAAPDGPFDVWRARRAWLDGVLDDLRALGPDMAALLDAPRAPTGAEPAPWAGAPADLDALAAALTTGTADDVAAATATVATALHLPADAFLRLLALRDTAAAGTMRAADWAEARAIVALAYRRSRFAAWRAEERAAGIRLDAAVFYANPRPVSEGTWPPEPDTAAPRPWVDPDRLAAGDLPRSVAGDEARALWARRAAELATNARTVRNARAAGWEQQVRTAVGAPPAGAATWAQWIAARAAELDDLDPGVVDAAVTAVRDRFGGTAVAAFRRIAAVNATIADGLTPAEDARADAERTLAAARKVAVLYPTWRTEETSGTRPLPYWRAVRHTLTQWLAPAEDRSAWLTGLATRARPPAIDPDLVPLAAIRTGAEPGLACAAENRHTERRGQLYQRAQTVRAELAAATATSVLARLDAALAAGLWTAAERDAVRADLAARRSAGTPAGVLTQVLGPDAGRAAALRVDLDVGGDRAAAATRAVLGDLGFPTAQGFRDVVDVAAAGAPPTPAQADAFDRTLAAAALTSRLTRAERYADILGLRVRDVLAPLRLDLPGWRRLLTVRGLAVAGVALQDAETADVVDICVRAAKEGLYGAWQAAEQEVPDADRVRLGPDSLTLPDEPWTPVEPPAWRVRPAERRAWRATLRARTEAHDAVPAALREAVARAEEACLPAYRDALLDALPTASAAPGAGARWAADHLLVDIAETGVRRTARVAHAIDTVLDLIWSVRTGQLADTYPDLALDAPTFNEDWRWIGSYATWRAAILVFLYPENLLRPTLRRHRSPAFREALEDLRAARQLTPAQARRITARYGEYLADIARLDRRRVVCAPVRTAWTPVLLESAPDRAADVRLLAAVSETSRRVYWALQDTSAQAAATGYAQSFWHRLDAFAAGGVTALVGATEYAPAAWAGGKRWLFLCALTRDLDGDRLAFARYDLTTATWDAEATSLDLPPGAGDDLTAWLIPVAPGAPPRVGFEFTAVDAGGQRETVRRSRALNAKGTNWAREDFAPLAAYGTWQQVGPAAAYDPAGITARALLAGDLDGDGRDELVVVPVAEAAPVVLRFDGAAWSALPAPPVTIPAGAHIAIGRFTAGDPRASLAWVGDGVAATLLSFRPNGWTTTTGWLPPLGATHAVAGDFDGDGVDELAVAGRTTVSVPAVPGSSAFWVLGTTPQGFAPKPGLAGTAPGTPDHRDQLDVAFGAAFRCAPASTVCTEGGTQTRPRPGFVVAGDFDGDGRAEIAAALDPVAGDVSQGNDLWVMDVRAASRRWGPLGDPAVNPDYPLHTVLDLSATDLKLLGAVAGDFDGDGRDEIIVLPFVERPGTGSTLPVADFQPGNDPADPARNGCWDALPALDLSAAVRPVGAAVAGDFDGDGADELVLLGTDTVWLRKFDIAADAWVELPGGLPGAGEPTSYAFGCAGDFTGAPSGAQIALQPGTQALAFPAVGATYLQRRVIGRGSEPRALAKRLDADPQRVPGCVPVGPLVPAWPGGAPWTLDDTLAPRVRAARSRAAALANAGAPATIQCYLDEAFYDLPVAVALALQASHDYDHALDWYRAVYDYAGGPRARKAWYGLVLDEHGTDPQAPADPAGYARDLLAWVRDPLDPHRIAAIRPHTYTRGTLQLLIRCLLDYADAEFARDTSESLERARVLYETAQDLLGEPVLAQRLGGCDDLVTRVPAGATVPTLSTLLGPGATAALNGAGPSAVPHAPRLRTFCVGPNPVLAGLRLHTGLNLFKLRSGRNIAGMRRVQDLYAAPTDQTSGLPMIGADGELVLPGLRAPAPTPYRYQALVEQARALAGQAREAEDRMVAALEKRDAEAMSLLRARQEIRVARASVTLGELRVRQAEDRVEVSQLQVERAAFSEDYYAGLISAGQLQYEREALGWLMAASGWQIATAISYQSIATFSGIRASAAYYWGDIMRGNDLVTQAAQATTSALAALGGNASTMSQWNSMQASFARTQQSWALQQQLSRYDRTIATAQVTVETDGARIAEQERTVNELQADNAEQLLEFQQAKFTNVDLYDWMAETQERTYRWYLQQATAMAQLAAAQLAFERQEDGPPAILADYWEPPAQGLADAAGTGGGPERRGVTGAERLLQDIAELEQYAFSTARRKQQLSRTVSLAQLDPLALARLRSDGVAAFTTPMHLFDEDFPGHHLRLIRRVALSVVALVPPVEGIRATLSTTGSSRVVLGPEAFQSVLLRREPESVSLTGASSATGLFSFDPPSGLRDPFEGLGVDTAWELRIPRPANPFDPASIADVLLTLDYTALDSPDLRARVIRELDRTREGERGFSLRDDFPDAWWDLTNPGSVAKPFDVSFGTRAIDFPPNLEEVEIAHVALALVTTTDPPAALSTVTLTYVENGSTARLGGTAAPVDRVVSTRRSNGGPWLPVTGKSVAGTWRLRLPDSEDARGWVAAGGLSDVLLVLSYRARTPAWPA
ncbi:neuraminidase-like domain-containing protein [Streptomyces sp. NPDC102340]|uniref:Tc toxin subunit A-related protein n=1 Tax=unclassified Streptomyces TaxID=2593676 RepID=UPI003816EC87